LAARNTTGLCPEDRRRVLTHSKKTRLPPGGRKGRSASARLSSQNAIDRLGSRKSLARDETVFRKGQSAAAIYKVTAGCIRTSTTLNDGRRMIVAFYYPGDYFGLEPRKKHAISAKAIAPSTVLVVARRALNSRAASDVAVAKQILAITNVELQRAQNHSLLLRNSAHERVANFLFAMKQRNRRKDVVLLMSRQDIADHLNLTIETVSRALKRLKSKSAISKLTRASVTVHLRKHLAA
jgi:CRP/FNR family nitrogen fixation transcriptional regulator